MDPRTWLCTPEILAKVEEQAKLGVTEANIARNVGLHPSTFSEKKKLHPELEEAIKKGHSVGEVLATGALWNMMTDPKSKGHVTAVIFYLKTKHGWNDGSRLVPTETTAPSGVKFEIIPSKEG